MSDIVRVLRIVEYIGPREAIEKQIERSIQGTRSFPAEGGSVSITATTITQFPELLTPTDIALSPRSLAMVADGGCLPDSGRAADALRNMCDRYGLDYDSYNSWAAVAEAITEQ